MRSRVDSAKSQATDYTMSAAPLWQRSGKDWCPVFGDLTAPQTPRHFSLPAFFESKLVPETGTQNDTVFHDAVTSFSSHGVRRNVQRHGTTKRNGYAAVFRTDERCQQEASYRPATVQLTSTLGRPFVLWRCRARWARRAQKLSGALFTLPIYE